MISYREKIAKKEARVRRDISDNREKFKPIKGKEKL